MGRLWCSGWGGSQEAFAPAGRGLQEQRGLSEELGVNLPPGLLLGNAGAGACQGVGWGVGGRIVQNWGGGENSAELGGEASGQHISDPSIQQSAAPDLQQETPRFRKQA